MPKTTALVKRETPKVRYRDSRGNEWESQVGQLNGCFRIPGDEQLYSVQSLIDFIRRNVLTVKVVGGAQEIDQGGTVTFNDALQLLGEPIPQTRIEPQVGKVKGGKNWERVRSYMVGQKEPVTKLQICEALGLSLTIVDREVKRPEVEEAGKVGTRKLYKVKAV